MGAVLLAVVLGVANNAVNPNGVPWVGSPRELKQEADDVHDSHWTGIQQAVKYTWRELGKNWVPVAVGLTLVVVASLFWRRFGGARTGMLVETWFRVGMAAMFLTACYYKLKNPAEFAMATAQYQLLPKPTVYAFAILMPALELVVSMGLLFTKWTREMYLLLAVMWVMFIVALAQALLRRLGITCGCFDIAGALSTGETWFSLLRDIVLLVPTIWYALMCRNRFWWKMSSVTHV